MTQNVLRETTVNMLREFTISFLYLITCMLVFKGVP